MHWKIVIVGAVVTAVAAGLSPARAAEPASASLVWGKCPVEAEQLKCATVTVPRDYRHPAGPSVNLTISRWSKDNGRSPRRTLLVIPGGPGDPGLQLPGYVAKTAAPELLDTYDLVSYDPRGVGHSSPITCGLPGLAETLPLVVPWPGPGGDISRNIAFARDAAGKCRENAGSLLRYMTTANNARDVDRIRAALGRPKLSVLGASYGSYVGAVYATLFPGRSDQVVLDSVVGPNLVWHDMWRQWDQAIEVRLGDFARWAATRDSTYHLGATPDLVRRTYFALTAGLDADPLPTPTLLLTGPFLRELTRSALYNDGSFPQLAATLAAVRRRDGAAAGPPVLRPDPGVPVDNRAAALFAYACGDVAWPRSVAFYQDQVRRDARRYPASAGVGANIWPCAFWADQPIERLVPVTSAGPRNVLLLQSRRDPGTPYAGALDMRRSLGQRASMVTVDSGRHVVYPFLGNTCVNDTTTAFLLHGRLPATDLTC